MVGASCYVRIYGDKVAMVFLLSENMGITNHHDFGIDFTTPCGWRLRDGMDHICKCGVCNNLRSMSLLAFSEALAMNPNTNDKGGPDFVFQQQ